MYTWNITIRTQRLLLRPWHRDDLDVMAAWPPFPDPLDAVWNWPQRFRREGRLDIFFLSQTADPARSAWAIIQADAVAGLLQLKAIRPAECDASLGLALGYPWVGQGYGREALGAFLQVYFERIGFTALRLEVALANARARRLYDALGFQEIGRFWRDAGDPQDYRFLDDPPYAALRPYFRWTGAGVYQLCAEMELVAARWHTSPVRRAIATAITSDP